MSTPERPADSITLDARTLRGLAHPVRIRMVGMLRHDGPSTATKLAERLGLSSAATSYHLRQLAAYGLIAEAQGLGSGRERWWRAAHRETNFDLRPSSDPDVADVGEAYLRGIAQIYSDNVAGYLDERATLPPDWQGAGTLSDIVLRLTPAESDELCQAIWAIVERQRRADDPAPGAPEGSRKVHVQLQVFPRPGDPS
jgi:DNA-binding transcriptional ArsR family regulator